MLKFIRFINDAIDRLEIYIKYLEDRNELQGLSDAQLRDIGICRGDIEYVARGNLKHA